MTAYSLPCMSVDRLSYIICLTLPRLQFPGHHGGVIFGTLPGLAKNYHRKHDYNMGSFRELGFPKTKTITKGANLLTGEGIILTADPQVMMGWEGKGREGKGIRLTQCTSIWVNLRSNSSRNRRIPCMSVTQVVKTILHSHFEDFNKPTTNMVPCCQMAI